MADRIARSAAAVPAVDAVRVGPGSGDVPTLGIVIAITGFPLLAAGYRAVIGEVPDLRVTGVVERRDRVADEVARLAADVVVIDVPTSPRTDSPSAGTIGAIRAARPAARILAIESRCGGEDRSPATGAGAHGLLSREASPGDVLAALRCLGRGETWSSASISTDEPRADATPGMPEVAADPVPTVPGAAGDDAFETLSERAREVFRLAAIGHSSLEIARELGVSEETVHDHRALIMQRLGLHRRVELLRYALRHGIVRTTEL
jgi:DNA-binding NarL/FixJ family response regulator